MRTADVFVNRVLAGKLIEEVPGKRYVFLYEEGYAGKPVSLTMPRQQRRYEFDRFPPFFEGLLPEGPMLESLLRLAKLERKDLMGQIITVGGDLVGHVTVREAS